jgi:hypothetical protein
LLFGKHVKNVGDVVFRQVVAKIFDSALSSGFKTIEAQISGFSRGSPERKVFFRTNILYVQKILQMIMDENLKIIQMIINVIHGKNTVDELLDKYNFHESKVLTIIITPEKTFTAKELIYEHADYSKV